MRIIECDRCHKRFNKDAKKTGYVNLDQRDINTGALDGNSEFDDWDICPDCMEKIRDFVRMVPKVRQEPDRPGDMFESTSIPTCLLIFDKHKETRRIAMIDLSDKCEEEVRDQRGQYGGASHEGRTYHKTVKVIPDGMLEKWDEAGGNDNEN